MPGFQEGASLRARTRSFPEAGVAYGITAQKVSRAVRNPKYGGGIHRDHLAKVLGVSVSTYKDFQTALSIAYRKGWIDFCVGYVVPRD